LPASHTSNPQPETDLNSARELPLAGCLAVLLLVIVFFGAIRYRLRDMPLERDEGEYAYAGQLLLQHIPPYVYAYNMKLPGIYAAYAGVMAVFGETPAGIHLGLLLLNAATTILLFFLTAQLFGSLAGTVTGISYALLSTSASVMGFEAHATNFVVFPALIGIWLLLRALQSERASLFFLSGLFFGVAVLMKQHGIFFALFGLIYLCWDSWKKSESNGNNLSHLLSRATICGSGVVLPYLATCWLMFRAGVFHQFWFWTVDYAGEYSKMGLRRAVKALLENSASVAAPARPVWVLAVVGLTAILWSARARRHARFLLLLFLFSFVALCPGAYFRPHYYILLLPITGILVGIAISCATDKLGAIERKPAKLVPVFVFVFCVAGAVLRQSDTYFSLAPESVVQSIYGNNAFVPAVKIADYIRDHSPSDARIAVLGSEPEIYFYASRHSATGYMYMYSLIVHHKYTERMRAQMMQELESNRPLYVVYVDVWDDWGPPEGGPQLAEFLPRLRAFMDESYDVVGIADIGENTQYLWDAAAQNYHPSSSKAIYVLKRKAGS
jgi:4-amino-4-deoxy-L-arabinose transferase-like glycosyltransferase